MICYLKILLRSTFKSKNTMTMTLKLYCFKSTLHQITLMKKKRSKIIHKENFQKVWWWYALIYFVAFNCHIWVGFMECRLKHNDMSHKSGKIWLINIQVCCAIIPIYTCYQTNFLQLIVIVVMIGFFWLMKGKEVDRLCWNALPHIGRMTHMI